MDSQQNLSQQTSEPPAQNKLWPINWKRNRVLKITGFIILFSLITEYLIFRGFAFMGISNLMANSPFFNLNLLFLGIMVILPIFNAVMFLSRLRKIDSLDIFLFLVCFLLFTGVVFLISSRGWIGILMLYFNAIPN